MDVIVLGLGVNGLAVTRSLGCRRLTVAGIYHDQDDLGRHSRYLSRVERLPEQYDARQLLTACLAVTATRDAQKNKPVIICTTDQFAETVAEHGALFEPYFLLTTPGKELYWRFLAKQATADICSEHHFPIPDTRYTKTPGQLISLTKSMAYPVIIKPDLTFDRAFPGKNVVVRSHQELSDFIARYPELETRVVVQNIVPSGDGNIYVVTCFCDNNAKVRTIYSGKKIRQYLPDYGVTCFGVSEHRQALKQTVIEFLEAIGYRGFATLEFAYDAEKDSFIFIELNIRTFYHNQLFKDAGLDINYLAYQLTAETDELAPCLSRQQDGVYWLDFTRDFGSFMRKRKSGQLTLLPWLRDISKARSFAYFDTGDLKPFIASVRKFIMISLSGFFRPNK
ncbi:hypothetical protein SG34_027525 [Thalassomonas viridans]|uniref:ATP-grasp domain-containing protein n=1 Tax=Thalassomonas viridans TaxID=137584 RepID=A0AAF0C9M7_9GAMM|nr:hypothetical protein [Thalassomonas viridans]WDE05009.1 hypothetical protein SG34_027525 [Thalassomonas viridans]